jgi:DNA-binding MarR family transcriptional regulator
MQHMVRCGVAQDVTKVVVNEISQGCLLTRTRQISRVLTSIYDNELRAFGLNAPQLTLLVMIGRLGPVSRAEIARQNHQERSTLTRNLSLLIAEGWVEEVRDAAAGRQRPLLLTASGKALLNDVAPAWRRAQEQAKKVLGDAGMVAVIEVAKGLSG